MLLCLSSARRSGTRLAEMAVEFADDVTFETADDLTARLAVRGSLGGVCLYRFVISHSNDCDAVDRGIRLPVAAAVQAHAGCLAALGGDRADATHLGQGGFGLAVSG